MTTLIYTRLTDEQLAAKVEELSTAYEKAVGGGVAVVAGEGRRMEYSRANAPGLYSLLTVALREQDRRSGVQVSGAIAVRYPHG